MTGPQFVPGARVRVGMKKEPGTVSVARGVDGEWTYDVVMDAGYSLSGLTACSMEPGTLPAAGSDAAR